MAETEFNEKEFIDKNDLKDRFTSARTKRCEDLMIPEAKALLDLPLDEKIQKSMEVIKDALAKYKNVGLGFSGGSDSLVLLHMVLQVKPDIQTVFSDTQFEFPETYTYIEDIRKDFHLTSQTAVMADKRRLEEFEKQYGLKTPEFTTVCCNYHKISPLMNAIAKFKFDAFLVGLRGVEHEERAKEVFFSPRHNPEHIRVHPMLFWRKEDVISYIKKYNLRVNPLYSQGYTSLGCTICTSKNTDPNAHERAGRGIVRETVMKRLRELGYT